MNSIATAQQQQLVLDLDDAPRVDSRVISAELESDHRSIYRMVLKYQKDFEEFGKVRFERAKPKLGDCTSKGEALGIRLTDSGQTRFRI